MSNLLGQSLGRYHILDQLGEGGMATVYKAYDTRLEADVAIKIIRTEEFPPKVLERVLLRFEREAKSLARLTHPNIVKVMDYGDYEGLPYLVMPYLPGGTLKERLKHSPLAWQEATRLLLPIVEALEYAHEHNLIHRDIKPSNILLTEKGQPMLTDFGIAKILEADDGFTLTGTGIGVGTPEYMAPEQWTGVVTVQSDIYSLGIVLYEMITGRKPYMADTPAAILLKQANDPLPRPRDFAGNLPDPVEQVILKCLAKNGQDRYSSAADLKRALTSLLEKLPAPMIRGQDATINESVLPEPTIEATIEAAPAHAKKFGGWSYAVIILLVAVIVGGIGGLLWFGWSKLSADTAPAQPLAASTTPPTATHRPTSTLNYEATKKVQQTRAAATEQFFWVVEFAQPILNNVHNRKPNFEDNFSEMSGRFVRWGDPSTNVNFTDGVMRINTTGRNGVDVGGSMVAADFVLEFDFTPRRASEGSVMDVGFRWGDAGGYDFDINLKGTWWALVSIPKEREAFNLVEGELIAAGINRTTHVTVIARDNRFAFFVDDQPLCYVEDSVYTDNWVGLGVWSPNGPAEVDFDNVKFWDLDNLKP